MDWGGGGGPSTSKGSRCILPWGSEGPQRSVLHSRGPKGTQSPTSLLPSPPPFPRLKPEDVMSMRMEGPACPALPSACPGPNRLPHGPRLEPVSSRGGDGRGVRTWPAVVWPWASCWETRGG